MATAEVIPMEEYLSTSYEHDCEWIEGEVRERGMPDEYHGLLQKFFLVYFEINRRRFGLRSFPELRLRVAPRRFRIPDVAVLAANAPLQPIPDTAPVLCVEVLSPDDSMSEMQEKISDYVAMGVEAIWIVDPRTRALFTADADGTRPVEVLALAGTEVRLTGAEIFAELDEMLGLGK